VNQDHVSEVHVRGDDQVGQPPRNQIGRRGGLQLHVELAGRQHDLELAQGVGVVVRHEDRTAVEHIAEVQIELAERNAQVIDDATLQEPAGFEILVQCHRSALDGLAAQFHTDEACPRGRFEANVVVAGRNAYGIETEKVGVVVDQGDALAGIPVDEVEVDVHDAVAAAVGHLTADDGSPCRGCGHPDRHERQQPSDQRCSRKHTSPSGDRLRPYR
jgi:hypothetical protein